MKDRIQLLWEGVSKPVQKRPDQDNNIIKSKCISCFERLNITNTGDLQPCNLLKINIGNILKDDFETIWNHSEIVQRLTNKELLTGKCGSCDYKFSCGGCRARAYAYSGDYMGEDIRCV
ncbi:MAG: SPASM domain-containing protein [Firmicutes bacterium]|nr:SPASM domain-containing protein [Bacillota bacterium]